MLGVESWFALEHHSDEIEINGVLDFKSMYYFVATAQSMFLMWLASSIII